MKYCWKDLLFLNNICFDLCQKFFTYTLKMGFLVVDTHAWNDLLLDLRLLISRKFMFTFYPHINSVVSLVSSVSQ